jgi:hypothetical protein
MKQAESQLLRRLERVDLLTDRNEFSLSETLLSMSGASCVEFSQYGKFTDITVRSYSLDKNADVERN